MFMGFFLCRTIQISHAEDNADPQNGRLPALCCGDWLARDQALRAGDSAKRNLAEAG
jgi:hypothetical protein